MVYLIIIDSNVWIFGEDKNSEGYEAASRKIQEVANAGPFGINAIIVSEVFHKLSKILGIEEAYSRTANIIRNPLAYWLELSQDTAFEAIALSKRERIRINDSLLAVQALELKGQVLTDNLRDFKKIRGLQIIPLR